MVEYGRIAQSEELLAGSRAEFSILAKTSDGASARRLSKFLNSDPRISSLRIRTPRDAESGPARLVGNVERYASTAAAVAFLLAGTAAYFFAAAVLASNRRFFATLRLLGASRWLLASLFLAFFVAPTVLAMVCSLAWFVPLALSGSVPTLGFSPVKHLFVAFPLAVFLPLVPGVAKIVASSALAGLSEPKPSIPSIRTAGTFALSAFAALSAYRLALGDSTLPAASWAFWTLLAGAALLALSAFAVRALSGRSKAWKERSFAVFDAFRLSGAPGSPAFATVSAIAVPAVLLAYFASFAFHFSEELDRLSSNAVDAFALNLRARDLPAALSVPATKAEPFSILRARIVAVNSVPLAEFFGPSGESREFSREFNLTSSPLPDRIEKGKRGTPDLGETSVDREFADRLGIGMGDRVTFSVMGREFPLVVSSIRESSREGIRPFFYFQVAEGEFANAPPSYFLSVNVPDPTEYGRRLVGAVGSHVSFVNVSETVSLVQSAASAILPVVWAFLAVVALLAFSVVVAVFSSVRKFRTERERSYRLLGADRNFLRKEALAATAFTFAAAFAVTAAASFPAAWGALLSAPFLRFSWTAAVFSVAATLAFLLISSGIAHVLGRK